jgi:hypothetical protein
MAAEQDGLGHFREAFAIHIASGQKYSDLFRNAAAAAQVFEGHVMHSMREAVLLKARLTGSVPDRHRNWGYGSTCTTGDRGILRQSGSVSMEMTGINVGAG